MSTFDLAIYILAGIGAACLISSASLVFVAWYGATLGPVEVKVEEIGL